MEDIKTSLVCSHCFKESPVKITYLENSMIKLTCERCGYAVKISQRLISDFSLIKWERRLITKPVRMALEAERDSLSFISTLPLRFITKPLRIVRELEKNLL